VEPDFGIGIGKGSTGRPRPALLVRGMEIAGLALVVVGLGGARIWLALVGALLVVGSYALYRRKHGRMPAAADPGGFDGDAGDGGE